MKVAIWSDIMCPFCYIGKRKFEQALEQFPHKDKIEIEWHSFQLNPDLESQPDKDVYDYVAQLKGQTREWSIGVHEQLVATASAVGLDYHFEKAKIVNSFEAHRLIQLAQTQGLGDAAEERLFKAYFTEGVNVADKAALIQLGTEIGLAAAEIKNVLDGDAFADKVAEDGYKAQALGIRGVPFFVMNNKYGVSGAQESKLFLQSLEKAYADWEQDQPTALQEVTEGDTCTPGGDCN
jgi:predicted DsbA family dithiol-disulfide isomerase